MAFGLIIFEYNQLQTGGRGKQNNDIAYMNELERLKKNNENSIPETGLEITIEPGLSKKSLDKLSEFMECIIKIEKLIHQSDDTWEKSLPIWFVTKAKKISMDEVFANSQLWDFGSWIDGIKHRGWKWWLVKKLDRKTVIYLETMNYPYNVDPFFYILYNIGVERDMIKIREIFPDSRYLSTI